MKIVYLEHFNFRFCEECFKMNRQGNQLPNNLPQLQNLIKRDSESYKEEFQQQLRHFNSTLAVFELSPEKVRHWF